ncbi:MAG: hypothetical protein ACYC2G_00515, partial [Gemmatimonadaceae bacterium]
MTKGESGSGRLAEGTGSHPCSALGAVLLDWHRQLRGELRDTADGAAELRMPSGTAEDHGAPGLMMSFWGSPGM